uniref:AIG1-type G domain-containing protein n=1 Tax=Catagonus wagneri TaxID=51154 RepID=A0A8C3XCA3_9CETA
ANTIQSEATGGSANGGTPQRLRLMLVGRPGSGKSATGNSILGRKLFKCKVSSRPVTQDFQRGCRVWAGRELEVIDTPDVLSPRVAPGVAAQGFSRALASSFPGPHAVLLVTQLGRFTEEDRGVVRRLQEVFGAGVLAYTVLVFTRKEDLEGGSLEEYLRETDNRELLRKLVAKCGGRCCAFSNRATGPEREAQVMELMRLVEDLVRDHGDAPYTNDVYHLVQALDSMSPEERLCRVAKRVAQKHRWPEEENLFSHPPLGLQAGQRTEASRSGALSTNWFELNWTE